MKTGQPLALTLSPDCGVTLIRHSRRLYQINNQRRVVINLQGLPFAQLCFRGVETIDFNRHGLIRNAGFEYLNKVISQNGSKPIVVSAFEVVPNYFLVGDWIRTGGGG